MMSAFYLIAQNVYFQTVGTSKYFTTVVQPHSVPSFPKPGRTQEKGRLLEINEEWDLSRCIAPVGMCAKFSAFAAHEL